MANVPPFDRQSAPFETKRHRAFRFEDRIERETKADSGIWVPYDLTNVTTIRFYLGTTALVPMLNLPAGPNTRDEEGYAITPDPTSGRVFAEATAAEMDLPEGDYLATWELTFTGGRTDEVPRGRTYRPVVIGTPLGP
jgi:hypothetical protein